MKFTKDDKGYTTSIIVLLLLIPVILLLIITLEENEEMIDATVNKIESNEINNIVYQFNDSINISTKQALHNLTLSVIRNKRAVNNASKELIKLLQESIDEEVEFYSKDGYLINCTILSITPAENPFQLKVVYQIRVSKDSNQINQENEVYVDIIDDKYPIYDPLPTLRTNCDVNANYINYTDRLVNIIDANNSHVYQNAIGPCLIKKCPYDDYTEHGHDNSTILNCLANHYYHNSHDGLCILCRLENRQSCSHMGIETFILPTMIEDNAVASIDHVLFNSTNQYEGNKILINNTTILYLDNGHKAKYGL